MTLPLPPRRVRLTTLGVVTYGYLIALVSAMLVGPPISFLIEDRDERTLLERGVLTRFDIIASRPTHSGGHQIDYAFEARRAADGAAERLSRQGIVSDEDFATFADSEKCLVLYDPADPENALPVTNRSALAERSAFDRKSAIWCYPASAAIILLFSAIYFQRLRRKLRLFRFGTAARPAVTQCRDGFGRGKPCVKYRFAGPDGKLREECQCFNFRIGISGDFAPYMKDAVAFYDPNDPRICELFLPQLAAFRFMKS